MKNFKLFYDHGHMIAILFPRFDHPAIEERYASWQSQMLLRKEEGTEFAFYDPLEPASLAAGLVDSDYALVVTDPLMLPPKGLPARLRDALLKVPEAVAALPVSNEAANAAQKRAPAAPYLTLRELQQVTAQMQEADLPIEQVKWDKSDPGAYLCRTALLDEVDDPPRRAIEGKPVVISGSDFMHRWSSLRGQTRDDLLSRIPADAKSILEFGCGEAPLGAALKARQKCRVVGIELDPRAAAIAKKRIDDVYCGDAREIVTLMREQFDWIIGGDIVEHLDEPWSFLSELRRVSKPGGHLLLSIPNIAHAALIADLLRGRFDYVYMGLTCVGHLRFFTRRTIEDMMTIAGWNVVEVTPQMTVETHGRDEVLKLLEGSRIAHSKEDLLPSGYYIVAQNPG